MINGSHLDLIAHGRLADVDWTGTLIGLAILGSGFAELRYRLSARMTRRPSSDLYCRVRRGSFLVTALVLGLLLIVAGLHR